LVNIAGAGKQLVNHAVHYATSQGYKTSEVGTGNASIRQLALYQICGFRIIGADKHFFIQHDEEEVFENGIHCRGMIVYLKIYEGAESILTIKLKQAQKNFFCADSHY
jgi:hypothetical protein